MSSNHLAIIREYIERSTHWREGGVTRHDALKVALPALEAELRRSPTEARRAALGNCQEQLQTAITHLQTVLNKCRTADEQQKADTAARDWLDSIGSEPT